MTKLTMKGAPFVWTDDCEVSFRTLKEKLVSAPILVLPEWQAFHSVHGCLPCRSWLCAHVGG
jgi:hypothetical protein